MADSTGASLTYGKLLISALALGRTLSRIWGPARHVGLLVPPTVPAAVANVAVSLWGKVPVNLNYSASQSLVDASIDQCGITDTLTSAKVLDRFKITPKGRLIFLEDIRKQVRTSDKIWAAAVARLVPQAVHRCFRSRVSRRPPGRDGHGDLHLGIDGRSQGRGALEPQYSVQRAPGRGASASEARRGLAGSLAVFSFIRIHDHDLDGHLPEQESGLSLQPA